MRLIDADWLYEKVESEYKFSIGIEHKCQREFLDLITNSNTIENTIHESNECEYCCGEPMRPLDWQYGLDHVFPDYKYCPMCGRRVRGDEMQTN